MKRIKIFGIVMEIPKDKTAVIKLEMRKVGSIEEINGQEEYFLEVIFELSFVPVMVIRKEFLLAKGVFSCRTDNAMPFNKELFERLHKEEFTEDQKSELGEYLLDKYAEGEVKEKDMRNKLKKIFDLKG